MPESPVTSAAMVCVRLSTSAPASASSSALRPKKLDWMVGRRRRGCAGALAGSRSVRATSSPPGRAAGSARRSARHSASRSSGMSAQKARGAGGTALSFFHASSSRVLPPKGSEPVSDR